MAKQGGKPKSNQPNYFTQNKQRYGEDFLDKINARDVQVNAIRLFRDIARGNIDIAKEGQYFMNRQFLDNCLIAAYSKYTLHSTNYNGVNMIVQNTSHVEQSVLEVLDYNRRCMEAYSIILTNLNGIIATGEVEYVRVMSNHLRNYRNNI